MFRKLFLLISILLLSTRASPQNLISNGDFEDYTGFLWSLGQLNIADGWNNLNGHYVGGPWGNPDYFHSQWFMDTTNGCIPPIFGEAYARFETYGYHPNYREYISSQLLAPLVPNQQYYLSFYLSNGTGVNIFYGSNNIGFHFSFNTLVQILDEPLFVTPQAEITNAVYLPNYWQKFSFLFTPSDTLKFVAIGNFRDDTITTPCPPGTFSAFFFIDNIELYPVPQNQTISGDSEICLGDTAILTASNGIFYEWADSTNPGYIISQDTTILVFPAVTTTYLVYGVVDTTSFTVHVKYPPTVNIGNDTIICDGETLQLNASTPDAIYQWQDMSDDSVFFVQQQGIYWVNVTVNQCTAVDSISIDYYPVPILDFGMDTLLCEDSSLELQAYNPYSTYLWQDNSLYAAYTVSQPGGTYWVELTHPCVKLSDTIVVTFESCNNIVFIPNIFSPNGDGENDILYARGNNISDFHIAIFNRWGGKQFESNDIRDGWNGMHNNNECSNGVYYYVAQIAFSNNTKKILEGSITIVR
jgi:gliding motility-associated-like protein